MACQETDRVPLYDLLRNDAAFAYFSGDVLPPLAADEGTMGELNRIAGKAVGAFLDMTRSVGFGPVEDAETTDEFGFVHRHSPFEKTNWIAARPFGEEKGASEFLKRGRETAPYEEYPEELERENSRYRMHDVRQMDRHSDLVDRCGADLSAADDVSARRVRE